MSVTNNPNNLYTVEIVVDDSGNSSPILYTASGKPYYKIAITPKHLNLIAPHSGYHRMPFAQNFKIPGSNNTNGYYQWRHTHNPNSNCVPPTTPHGINCSFTRSHSYHLPSSCGGGISTSFSRRSVQGPIRFLNTDYTNGAFLSDNVPVTWSEINLVEVYQLEGFQTLINDSMENGELLKDNSWEWQVWDGVSYLPSPGFHYSGKPIRIDAYVFIVYDPSTPMQRNETIAIDFDCSDTIVGCTDPTAINGTYNPNATVSDPTLCQYPPPEYTVELVANVDYYGGSSGPYTDGSMYTHSNGMTYITIDFDETANPNGNIQLGSGTVSQTITLPGTYQAGVSVQHTEEFFIYPSLGYGGFNVYNYPFAGSLQGPNGNISPTPGYSQRMYYGWGNTKNNLTAASLRIQQPFTGTWESPMYIDPNYVNYSPVYSEWHNGADPTGLRPTQIVNFNNFDDDNGITITNSVTVLEMYQTSPFYEQFEWFPEKLKVTVDLNFIMPTPQSGTVFSIPINLYHNTENQGDLSWVDPNII
tara:strand:- start:4893 stop:6479 length:1587 start_codon:yes stop_codon:yes gene_type:complete